MPNKRSSFPYSPNEKTTFTFEKLVRDSERPCKHGICAKYILTIFLLPTSKSIHSVWSNKPKA